MNSSNAFGQCWELFWMNNGKATQYIYLEEFWFCLLIIQNISLETLSISQLGRILSIFNLLGCASCAQLYYYSLKVWNHIVSFGFWKKKYKHLVQNNSIKQKLVPFGLVNETHISSKPTIIHHSAIYMGHVKVSRIKNKIVLLAESIFCFNQFGSGLQKVGIFWLRVILSFPVW